MTDNEIIKAAKICFTSECKEDRDCPYFYLPDCKKDMRLDLFYLADRQKAEIERLKEEREMLLKECKRCERRKDKRIRKLKNKIETARAEGIKDFAEMLKKRFYSIEYKADTKRATLPIDVVKDQMEWIFKSVCTETIDYLVKEMTESEVEG